MHRREFSSFTFLTKSLQEVLSRAQLCSKVPNVLFRCTRLLGLEDCKYVSMNYFQDNFIFTAPEVDAALLLKVACRYLKRNFKPKESFLLVTYILQQAKLFKFIVFSFLRRKTLA